MSISVILAAIMFIAFIIAGFVYINLLRILQRPMEFVLHNELTGQKQFRLEVMPLANPQASMRLPESVRFQWRLIRDIFLNRWQKRSFIVMSESDMETWDEIVEHELKMVSGRIFAAEVLLQMTPRPALDYFYVVACEPYGVNGILSTKLTVLILTEGQLLRFEGPKGKSPAVWNEANYPARVATRRAIVRRYREERDWQANKQSFVRAIRPITFKL